MFIEICWHVLETTFLIWGKASDNQKQLYRSAHRGGSLGSEILLPGRTGASPFLQLSSRTEILAYCKALLMYGDSVVSLNRQNSPGKKQSCQHNCRSSKSFCWHSSVANTNVLAGAAEQMQLSRDKPSAAQCSVGPQYKMVLWLAMFVSAHLLCLRCWLRSNYIRNTLTG